MPQWGAVERQPRVYDFSGYRAFVQVAKRMGLKLQAVMSFHACGANVGDTAQVPLPAWVLKVRSVADPWCALRSAGRSWHTCCMPCMRCCTNC